MEKCRPVAADQVGEPLRHGRCSLRVRLFGTFYIEQDGLPFPRLRSRKEQWLFALLTLHSAPLERERLAGMLWPDSPQDAALANLRRSLTQLRNALGAESTRLIADSPRFIRMDLTGAEVDVLDFDAAVEQGDGFSLRKAVALYGGPLFPACDLDEVFTEREMREEQYLGALERLASMASSEGDLTAAVGFLRSAIAADPLRETAHRALMSAYAARSEHSAAIQAYRDLRLLLHERVRTEPAPETSALYEEIRMDARRQGEARKPPLAGPIMRGRLPTPLSELIGRDKEIDELERRLESSRLLTLTGPGGIGKTRLAIALSVRVADDYADGLWFVDLSSIASPEGVPHAVSSAMSIPEHPGQGPTDAITSYLGSRRGLLVLDNCEHLVEACAQLSEPLLLMCPNLRILATSRQPLGVQGELAWVVPALETPPLDLSSPEPDPSGLDDGLTQYGAVRLFLARGQLAVPRLTLTKDNAHAIAEICRRLDGIPLAIELAASQVRGLSPAQLAERLDRGLRLQMRGGPASSRHQTLGSTLDWGHRLLSPKERTLFRRLAVFSGGWSLDAAESICSGTGIARHEVVGLLLSLTDSSLVTSVERYSQTRYGFLETIRQYADEKLAEAGEHERFRSRHFSYFSTLAHQVDRKKPGRDEALRNRLLDEDYQNLLTALDRGEVLYPVGAQSLKLATALTRFWTSRGYLAQARVTLERLLAGAQGSPPTRARGFLALGRALRFQHAYNDSIAACENSLRIARSCHDKRAIAEALMALGSSCGMSGDNARARRCLEESVTILKDEADPFFAAESLGVLGNIAKDMGSNAEALNFYEQSLARYRQLNDPSGIAVRLQCCGFIYDYQGDLNQAASLYAESLQMLEQLGNVTLMAYALHHLAALKRKLGDLSGARALLDRPEVVGSSDDQRPGPGAPWQRLSLALCSLQEKDVGSARANISEALNQVRSSQDNLVTAFAVATAGVFASVVGEAQQAAYLFGAADGIRSIDRVIVLARAEDAYGPAHDQALAALGNDGFRVTWEAGRAIGRNRAIEQAIEFAQRPR